MGTVTRLLFLVLIAVLAIGYPDLILVFFIPIAGWFIWRDQDRIAALEKKLEALESSDASKPEGISPPPQGGLTPLQSD
jgi:hypothetical protein